MKSSLSSLFGNSVSMNTRQSKGGTVTMRTLEQVESMKGCIEILGLQL